MSSGGCGGGLGDARPDPGTDISVTDRTDTIGSLIYEHLVANTPTEVAVWMMDGRSVFVQGRGVTAEQQGL